MPKLTRIDTDDEIGSISQAHVDFLIEQTGAEEDEDHCMINSDTLELLSDNGADPELIAMLEKGLGDDEQMSVSWG